MSSENISSKLHKQLNSVRKQKHEHFVNNKTLKMNDNDVKLLRNTNAKDNKSVDKKGKVYH